MIAVFDTQSVRGQTVCGLIGKLSKFMEIVVIYFCPAHSLSAGRRLPRYPVAFFRLKGEK